MPTRDRRRFVGQAIWYFLRQDYDNAELIVVDDGTDPVGDLVPRDSRIRYTRLDNQVPLGAKRNIACQLSNGELIAHWDDDDWIAPHRLSAQADHLLATHADVCGVSTTLHFRLHAGDAWSFQPPEGTLPWIAGGTLLYRRDVWAANPFPETRWGEDTAFLKQLPPGSIRAIEDPSLYIALIHPGNIAARNLSDPCWQRRPLHEVTARLAPDRDFYVALRNGRAAVATVRPPLESITVAAPFMVYDGYGSLSEYLVMGLERSGARVQVAPLRFDPAALSSEFNAILQRSRPQPGDVTLCFSWPRENLARFRNARDLFINTMWETSKLPSGWADILNQARAIIAPSHFVSKVFRDSGVTVPVEVVPYGVDPAVYHYEARPERAGLTTLTVGTFVPRKNIELGIAAWKQAFAGDQEARLIIKTRFRVQPYVPDDPRILFVDSEELTHGIAHWYRQADVLLALGNEGFGLPLVEGMATGLPVVALASEGQGDVCAGAEGLVLPVQPDRWEEFDYAPFGWCGVRGVPAVADVANQLRWVAGHRDEARAMGRAASEWTLKHRNIWSMGPATLDVMEQYTQPPRLLRRCYTLWACTGGTGGTGEASPTSAYTAALIAALPAVRVVASPTDLRGVRLLHIQHEEGNWNDAELARHIQQCRYAGVPVAITEHSVGQKARPWERDADVLVALNPEDATLLRERWPAKRIEMLPPGCPTWSPPRKPTRERVVGVFAGSGIEELAGRLHLLSGVTLLLFGPPLACEADVIAQAKAAGLPVRRLNPTLSGSELASELAQAADVLVYWSDGCSQAYTRHAALLGLASGVPVVTSREGFSGLRSVTYQPSDLTEGIEDLLGDMALRERLASSARSYCHEHTWTRAAEAHLALWRTLESGM
ncbi:MAG TPA: glycosyltransferase [Chloroflexia bacterium]|jgi:glycosyltransferase involved in cell wall biosynthesis